MSSGRELRALVEQLQTELQRTQTDEASGKDEVARLKAALELERKERGQIAAELEVTRKAALDADAAFNHVVKRQRQNEAAVVTVPRPTTALSNDGIPPTSLELWIRFGLGSLVGAIVGVGMAVEVESSAVSWMLFFGSTAVAGLMARHYGDRFWFGGR